MIYVVIINYLYLSNEEKLLLCEIEEECLKNLIFYGIKMTNLLLDVRPVRVCLRCGGGGERHPGHHLDSLLLRGGHTRHLRPPLEGQQVRGIK